MHRRDFLETANRALLAAGSPRLLGAIAQEKRFRVNLLRVFEKNWNSK
jgi:hypothetical protein